MADFVKVARISSIPTGEATIVDLEGEEVCVANVEGRIYAIGNGCSHRGGPLGDGQIDGEIVTCPWHGGEFNLKTGEALSPPASLPQPTYQVQLDGDDIKIARE